MTEITDQPPNDVQIQVDAIDAQLDEVVPAKTLDRNLLIGTWNIRGFGDITQKWRSDARDSPKRDLSDVLSIAKILSRFDVVAVQEVKDNIKGLRHMMKVLGEDWAFLLTDTVKSDEGNYERLAFLFDRRRVRLSGLACELVVTFQEQGISEGALTRQFARTPYAISFLSGDKTFILITLHVLYGKKPADRIPELTEIARWLAEWAKEATEWGHNIIALGDFNIDRQSDPLYEAFTSTGLTPPDELNRVPRTIFDDPEGESFYDQIAWFRGDQGVPLLSLDYVSSGTFDFANGVIPFTSTTGLSWHISDHYPLWVEFSTRAGRGGP